MSTGRSQPCDEYKILRIDDELESNFTAMKGQMDIRQLIQVPPSKKCDEGANYFKGIRSDIDDESVEKKEFQIDIRISIHFPSNSVFLLNRYFALLKLLSYNELMELFGCKDTRSLINNIDKGVLTDSQLNKYFSQRPKKTLLYILVEKGKVDFVKFILGIPGIDVNKGTNVGETPLMCACKKENPVFSIINLLLSHPKIDINSKSKVLYPTELRSFKSSETALHIAVKGGNTKLVRLLLNHSKIDVSATDSFGRTAHMRAAEQAFYYDRAENLKFARKYKTIQFMFEMKGCEQIQFRNDKALGFGNVARLALTIDGSHTSLMSFLEYNEESINDRITCGKNITLKSCSKLPKALNEIISSDDTALSIACRLGHKEFVTALLTFSRLDVCKFSNINAQNYFSEFYFSIPNVCFPLMYAHSDVEITKLLLSHPNIDINQKNIVGETALMEACRQGSIEVVKEMLKQPLLDINCKSVYGETALVHSVDHEEIVKLLIADNRFDKKLVRQACIFAAKGKSFEAMKLLLSSFQGTEKEIRRLKMRMLKHVYQFVFGTVAVERIHWLYSKGAYISNNDYNYFVRSGKGGKHNHCRFIERVFLDACEKRDYEKAKHFLTEPFFSRYKIRIDDVIWGWKMIHEEYQEEEFIKFIESLKSDIKFDSRVMIH
jgi:ankyrin repeat protein